MRYFSQLNFWMGRDVFYYSHLRLFVDVVKLHPHAHSLGVSLYIPDVCREIDFVLHPGQLQMEHDRVVHPRIRQHPARRCFDHIEIASRAAYIADYA